MILKKEKRKHGIRNNTAKEKFSSILKMSFKIKDKIGTYNCITCYNSIRCVLFQRNDTLGLGSMQPVRWYV